MKNNKPRTKCENVKQIIVNFFASHDNGEKELYVSIFLDARRKTSICNLHIDSGYREIIEDDTKAIFVISNYADQMLTIPDDVTIRYDEVTRCEATVRTGETKDDIVADVLEITFKNGTVLELGVFVYLI